MSSHGATVRWVRGDARFVDNRYPRRHTWTFDGGAVVEASSSPSTVPIPLSDPTCVDPEEAFVAALSSCHLLWFLSIAAKAGFVVEAYEDDAVGLLGPDATGQIAITEITLRPRVTFAENAPSDSELAALHAQAHERCFLARSVRGVVRVSPSGSSREPIEP